MAEYKITEVVSFSEQTYGRFGNYRAVVKLEGVEKNRSAFLKELPKVGDIWNGELTESSKDGRTFYNFEFEKKGFTGEKFSTSNAEVKNLINLIVVPKLEQLGAQGAKNELLIKALGDRMDKIISGNLPEEEVPENPF